MNERLAANIANGKKVKMTPGMRAARDTARIGSRASLIVGGLLLIYDINQYLDCMESCCE